jgi:RNA polymerase sigma-70 factor (ECF subfamily)
MPYDDVHPSKMSDLALNWGKAKVSVSAFVHSVVLNHHDAEDVIQATVTYIAHHYDDYDPSTPFEAWAITVARYRMMEQRHQNRRKPLLLDEEALNALSKAMVIEARGVDDRLEALEHCIGKLSDRHREVLDMRYTDQCSRQAIADSLNIKPQSVSVLLRKVRQTLAECVSRRIGGVSS